MSDVSMGASASDSSVDFASAVADAFADTDTSSGADDAGFDDASSDDGQDAIADDSTGGADGDGFDDADGGEDADSETDDGTGEEPAQADAQADENASEEELPEGVRVVDKDGKKEYRLKQSRYELFHGAHKMRLEAEQVLGEPLTREAIQERQSAFVDREAMIADFFSGDPAAETRILQFLDDIGAQGREAGEVGHDPMVNLAARIPEFMAKRPEAYRALAEPVLRQQISALHQEARNRVQANQADNDLLLSIQHIEQALFGAHTPQDKILAAPAQIDQERQRFEQERAEWNQAKAARAQQEYQQYHQDTSAKVKTTIADVISAKLKPVESSYKGFPEDFRAVTDLLNREFQQAVKNDAAWQTWLTQQTRKAQNAATPSARAAIQEQIVTRFKAKADHLLDPARNTTVKDILSRRAALIKSESDARHQRRANSAARREPGSTGAPVRQSIGRPSPNGATGRSAWKQAVDEVFSS